MNYYCWMFFNLSIILTYFRFTRIILLIQVSSALNTHTLRWRTPLISQIQFCPPKMWDFIACQKGLIFKYVYKRRSYIAKSMWLPEIPVKMKAGRLWHWHPIGNVPWWNKVCFSSPFFVSFHFRTMWKLMFQSGAKKHLSITIEV